MNFLFVGKFYYFTYGSKISLCFTKRNFQFSKLFKFGLKYFIPVTFDFNRNSQKDFICKVLPCVKSTSANSVCVIFCEFLKTATLLLFKHHLAVFKQSFRYDHCCRNSILLCKKIYIIYHNNMYYLTKSAILNVNT